MEPGCVNEYLQNMNICKYVSKTHNTMGLCIVVGIEGKGSS